MKFNRENIEKISNRHRQTPKKSIKEIKRLIKYYAIKGERSAFVWSEFSDLSAEEEKEVVDYFRDLGFTFEFTSYGYIDRICW